MAKSKTEEIAIIDFTKFSIQQLPELQGKKKEIDSIIKANPIVEITDNASYELAKKSRTTVKTLRTNLEKEQKEVNSRIKKNVLEVVANEYNSLINQVREKESERQEPITVYEAKKEEERLEKQRLEEERVNGIKTKIDEIATLFVNKIQSLSFGLINDFKEELSLFKTIQDKSSFQEFEVLYDDKMDHIDNLLASRIATLSEQEEIRVEQIRLAEERAENERKETIKKGINYWFDNWSLVVDDLQFSESKDLFNSFVKEQALDCQEFQSEYAEKRSSLIQKFESKIALLKQIEDNRIAAEKLAKEKADFEAKQAENKKESEFTLKVNKRIDELISYGLNFDFKSTYTDGNFFVDVLDIKTYSEEKWDKLIEHIIKVSKEKEDVVLEASEELEYVDPKDTLTLRTTNEIDEIANNDSFVSIENYHEADVDPKGIIVNNEENLSENIQFENLDESGWELIRAEFSSVSIGYDLDDFVNWLSENFLVPERKNK